MPRLLRLCGQPIGLLLVLSSLELGSAARAKKLCGRHLMQEIVQLCGLEDWSLFPEEPRYRQPVPRAVDAVGAFLRAGRPRPRALPPGRGTGTQPVSTAASTEEAINSSKMQSLTEHQHRKDHSPPDKTREVSSSHSHPDSHEIMEFQEKHTNKMKASSDLFWGNHPQRKRRGYSEKCCLSGCTEDELSIACLPYIDYKQLQLDHQL
ncbi:insulin-like peptide INSL6 isoform X1 [Loxodonta africana]|uniref:insulin-like peptide INSL6 isoform X1 n=1 Tax=Loxodonta africana TaxID=9785 RepID=UPI0030CC489B